jgi:hypothetical protein
MQKNKPKDLQVIEMKGDSANQTDFPGLKMPKRKEFKPKDCLRLQSQLIRGFINGTIRSERARELSYHLTSYITTYKAVELESRLDNLELKLEDKGAS